MEYTQINSDLHLVLELLALHNQPPEAPASNVKANTTKAKRK